MTGVWAAVVGVGNEFRRDDGIGPRVAVELEGHHLPGVRVAVCDGEPAGLLHAWNDVKLAIVVDAVLCEPATPGRIWRTAVEGRADDAPAPHGDPDQVAGLQATGGASSHAMGVPEALLLGRALDRVPDKLVVFAVEAADLDLGTELSPEVAAAHPRVVRAVLAELERPW